MNYTYFTTDMDQDNKYIINILGIGVQDGFIATLRQLKCCSPNFLKRRARTWIHAGLL